MNISHEFFKVKQGFKKVKEDMNYLSEKISENYDEFTRRHKVIARDIENITLELKEGLEFIKKNHLHSNSTISDKEILDLRNEISELKKEIIHINKEHGTISSALEEIKSNKKEIKELKEKLHSGELELFLLKERLVEKDQEIKQIKDISKHLFGLIEELSKTELDIINLKGSKSRK